MKMEVPVSEARPQAAVGEARHFRRFAAVLAPALLAIALLARPTHTGDFPEYALMTVAIASHGTPDIRPSDVAEGRALLPDFAYAFDTLQEGLRADAQVPLPGFFRGDDGRTYAIHFFAYSALAAVPYKLLQALSFNPFRCFQTVNLASVFVLGLSLFRLFRSGRRAALGVLTFLLCGGMLYLQWSSPECMSAAVLLAAMVLFATGAPLAGGVLAGLAAMQNPAVVLFCAFAPLLTLSLQDWSAGALPTIRRLLQPRYFAGLAATAMLFVLPILHNLHLFHTPSIIAKVGTSSSFITLNRLHAFFLDLNQGVLVGVPAVVLALAAWAATRQARALALCGAACAFSLALAVPALAVQNWNSAAAGIMRYALWASMPLVFALLWRLHAAPRWPALLLGAVLAGQALAMANANCYNQVEFSPLATRVIERAPGWYNPDPETFYERLEHRESSFPDPAKVFTYRVNDMPVKTLYNTANASADEHLCGAGSRLAPGHPFADAGFGWRYLNGPPRCMR